MTTTPSAPEVAFGVPAMARNRPEALAFERGTETMTYAELDALADRLAQRLIDEAANPAPGTGALEIPGGDEPYTCVPIMVEDTKALLVAVESVRRAGMVAVPVDPNTPPSRFEYLVQKVKAPFVLSDSSAETLGGAKRLGPLEDGMDAPEPVQRPLGRLGRIVFTSGSTGEPKGVLRSSEHPEGILPLMAAIFGQEPVRVGTVLAGSVAASIPMVDLFVSCGWAIVPFEIRSEQQSPAAWLRQANVRVLAAVPTVLRQLVSQLAPDEVVEGLQFVGVFGESMTWEDVAKLRPHLKPGHVIFNVYAQSEAGDISLMAIDENTPLGTGRIPVGSPLPGKKVVIVDDEGNPLADGETGQIAVQSTSAGLGYLGDEAKTASVFFPQPDGTTLVNTGDLGRIGADGTLEHLGRMDDMVKIAGNRVDLGEVESLLRTYYWVVDAAATTYLNNQNELRLRAFVQLQPSRIANPRVIRGWLLQRLPRYAVPDFIEQVDELPRLTNGKVDRLSLPTARPRLAPAAPAPVVPAHSAELEGVLLSIWQELLAAEDLAVDDNFFDVGGDSLLAVELVAAMSERTGTDVPLGLLIENPTVASMAAALSADVPGAPVITMQSGGPGMPLFVVHDGHGSLFGARHYIDALGLQQPIFGLQAPAWDTTRSIDRSLEALAAHHVDYICEDHPHGSVCILGWSTGCLIAFEIARQLEQRGRTVGLLVLGAEAPPPTPVLGAARKALGILTSTPRGQLPAAVNQVALKAVKVAKRRAKAELRSYRHRQSLKARPDHLPEVPITERPKQAFSYHEDLVLTYFPPGRFHGPALVITPPWLDRERLERWRYWLAGPLRFADPDTLLGELKESPVRSVERVAP